MTPYNENSAHILYQRSQPQRHRHSHTTAQQSEIKGT